MYSVTSIWGDHIHIYELFLYIITVTHMEISIFAYLLHILLPKMCNCQPFYIDFMCTHVYMSVRLIVCVF